MYEGTEQRCFPKDIFYKAPQLGQRSAVNMSAEFCRTTSFCLPHKDGRRSLWRPQTHDHFMLSCSQCSAVQQQKRSKLMVCVPLQFFFFFFDHFMTFQPCEEVLILHFVAWCLASWPVGQSFWRKVRWARQ